jgi:hypothetical protein
MDHVAKQYTAHSWVAAKEKYKISIPVAKTVNTADECTRTVPAACQVQGNPKILYYNNHAMDFVAIQEISFRCNTCTFQCKLLLKIICACASNCRTCTMCPLNSDLVGTFLMHMVVSCLHLIPLPLSLAQTFSTHTVFMRTMIHTSS